MNRSISYVFPNPEVFSPSDILCKNSLASLDGFVAATLGQSSPASAAAFAAQILGEHNFNPNEPRDEKGRWTTGGSSSSTADETGRLGKMEQKDVDAMVEKLGKSPEGKELLEKAEKAAKDIGAEGLTIKAEPRENLPNSDEAACNPKTGTIGIRDDLSDAKLLESLIVELGNMARAKELADLQTTGITRMTRDQYIKAMEGMEFLSVQDTARVWKAVAEDCGQDASNCPSYGNPDDVLKLDFKTHFNRVTQSHKENYGKQWDRAN
jgi:hypothetical protein